MKKQKVQSYEDMHNRTVRMLKDPLTYIGIGLTAAPIMVSHFTGIDIKSMSSEGKAAYFLTPIAGNAIFAWSYTKNGVNPFTLMRYRKELKEAGKRAEAAAKKRQEAYERWKDFMVDELTKFERTGIEQLSPLIERGWKMVEDHDYKPTQRLFSDLYAAYERHKRISKRESKKPIELHETHNGHVDGVFSIVPSKTYSNILTPGQQQRLRYFVEDMEGMVPDALTRAEIYCNLRKSGWYKTPLSDVQTYMLFDDVTRDVRSGSTPSESSVRSYASHVIAETTKSAK